MARLHIIESHKDVEIARRFADGLHRHHHTVSWDVDFLVPGEEWKRSLREALAAADGLIALLSETSVQPESNVISSQWMAADIGAARASGKFVLPVIVGDSVQIPALIDDIFAVRASDTTDAELKEVTSKIDDAIGRHMERRAKESALYLPNGYEHLASSVLRFREDGPYDESVFVMMKFPDPNVMEAKQCKLLRDIWEVLVQVLSAYDLKARRADKKTYHDQLWENICVYMLGSRYGIAILEDRVAEELNPNVALEYGFMKSLNRGVALFRDVNFKHDRADLTGKLAKSFEIDNSGELMKETLAKAVQDWLLDIGVSQVQRY
jgi:hypothetical protein